MMDERNYHDVGILFPYFAGLTDRSLRFVERSDFTGMNVLYTEIVTKVVFRSNRWDVGRG